MLQRIAEFTLEVSKDGKTWTKVENKTDKGSKATEKTTMYGDKIYARLTDGDNTGKEFVYTENRIDKVKPTDTAPTGTATTDTITATLKQTDSGDDNTSATSSGIDASKTKYRLVEDATGTTAVSGRDWQTSNKFTGLKQNETYYIQTKVTDKAGNTTISKVTTIKTTEVPSGTTSGVITLTSDHNTWTNTDVKVTASSSKTGFTIQVSTDGKTFKDGNKVTLTANGTVYARLRDASNNYGGTASKTISIIDKTAPTLDLSKETYQEGFNNWTSADAQVKDNILTLDSSNKSFVSNYYKTGNEKWWITFDAYTETASTKHDGNYGSAGKGDGGLYWRSSYYDSQYTSTKSQNSYSANGWAPQLPLNTWSNNFNWNGWNGYGNSVEYVTIYTETGNQYSNPPVQIRNFRMHGQLYSTFYLINQKNADADSKVKVVKYAQGNQTVSYFKTAGTTVTSGQINVKSNGTYTIYVEDNAGNSIVKTIDINKVDTTPATTTAPSVAQTTYSITVTNKQADAESGLG